MNVRCYIIKPDGALSMQLLTKEESYKWLRNKLKENEGAIVINRNIMHYGGLTKEFIIEKINVIGV